MYYSLCFQQVLYFFYVFNIFQFIYCCCIFLFILIKLTKLIKPNQINNQNLILFLFLLETSASL